jgi:hypothetical protein
MADNSVIVYSPAGEPERHSRANARDLVQGAGYTWMRFMPASPAGYAPFAAVQVPKGSLSQEVLDKASGKETDDGASGAASAAAQAMAQQQAQIAAALAQQQAAAAAAQAMAEQQAAAQAAAAQVAQAAAAAAALAAATPEPEVKDFSAPEVDSSDLDADPEEAAAEDAPAAPRKRGGRRKA